jgi:hypothetical protein
VKAQQLEVVKLAPQQQERAPLQRLLASQKRQEKIEKRRRKK